MSLVLQGKKPAPDPGGFFKMPTREKADALQIVKLFSSYCRDPNVENYLKVVAHSAEKDKRTCLISANHFTQKFRPVDPNTWTVVAQPYAHVES